MILQLLTAFFSLLMLTCCSSEKKLPKEDVQKLERQTQRHFIGKWKVSNDAGAFFYIAINPDGTASSTWNEGERGRWEVKEDRMILTWPSGWRDVLFEEDGAFKKIAFAPDASMDEEPTSHAKAERVASIPVNQ